MLSCITTINLYIIIQPRANQLKVQITWHLRILDKFLNKQLNTFLEIKRMKRLSLWHVDKAIHRVTITLK